MWKVIHFKTSSGRRPVHEFIMDLQPSAHSKTMRVIAMLRDYGPNMIMPQSRQLAKNLYELRIKDRQAVRIFYCFTSDKRAILLHAFIKKSFALPAKELATAYKRRKIVLDQIID